MNDRDGGVEGKKDKTDMMNNGKKEIQSERTRGGG